MKHPGYETMVLIMEKFKDGDSYAFGLIFHIFYLDLCFFSKRIIEKPREAEELVEKIFIELWNSEKRFKDLIELKTFLYTTTRDECYKYIDQLRKGICNEAWLALSEAGKQRTNLILEKEIIRPGIREILYKPLENLPLALKKIICPNII